MCPDWESSGRPFGSPASTQSTEPHQPGLESQIFKTVPKPVSHSLSWHPDSPPLTTVSKSLLTTSERSNLELGRGRDVPGNARWASDWNFLSVDKVQIKAKNLVGFFYFIQKRMSYSYPGKGKWCISHNPSPPLALPTTDWSLELIQGSPSAMFARSESELETSLLLFPILEFLLLCHWQPSFIPKNM